MYSDSAIYVIPSRSLGQAYTAMSMLDISLETPEEMEENFITNMNYAATGMVCRASRDFHGDELTVSEEDYVGMTDQKLLSASPDKIRALEEMCLGMGIEDREIATLIFGEDATEEDRDKVRNLFRNKWEKMEFYEIDGRQELYDFIVILE